MVWTVVLVIPFIPNHYVTEESSWSILKIGCNSCSAIVKCNCNAWAKSFDILTAKCKMGHVKENDWFLHSRLPPRLLPCMMPFEGNMFQSHIEISDVESSLDLRHLV